MKFQFVEQIRNKQQQLGEPHDFTHIDELQQGHHGNRAELVAQTLDIKADQAVVHIHIGGVGKRLQAAVGEYIQHQCQLLCAAQVGFVQIPIQITKRWAGRCIAGSNQRLVNVFEAGGNQASVLWLKMPILADQLVQHRQHKLDFGNIGRHIGLGVVMIIQRIVGFGGCVLHATYPSRQGCGAAKHFRGRTSRPYAG